MRRESDGHGVDRRHVVEGRDRVLKEATNIADRRPIDGKKPIVGPGYKINKNSESSSMDVDLRPTRSDKDLDGFGSDGRNPNK